MFFIRIISFFVKVFAVLMAVVVLQTTIIFAIWTVRLSKKLIALVFINNVHHVIFYPPQKKYKREAVETGYTMNTYGTSTHYCYRNVYCGLYRDVIVFFKGGFKIKMNLCEDEPLYKRLLEV